MDNHVIRLDPLKDFTKWVLYEQNNDFPSYAFAHFGGRYDCTLIFGEMVRLGIVANLVRQGNRLYEMNVSKTEQITETIFRDSFNYVSQKLESLSEVRQILTLNPINDRPFHFKIHANTSYLDLTKFYVFTEMRICKLSVGGVPGDCLATDDVGVIQNVGSTFIKNIKVSINGREIYDSNSLYAYKTYLDTEFL